jgi:SPP1 family predicted phage head-tail adaptor
MQAGKLDRVITIERSTYVDDGYGNQTYVWSPIATLRAQVIQATTEEFMRAWGVSSEIAIIFRTRYLDGVSLSDRIRYEGEFLNIKEVKELGRRRGLEIRTARSGP